MRFGIEFLLSVLITSGAQAEERSISGVKNWIGPECQITEQEVKSEKVTKRIRAWMKSHSESYNPKMKPPVLYRSYLSKRYDVQFPPDGSLDEFLPAMIAGLADMPPALTSKFGGFMVRAKSNCESSQLMSADTARKTMHLCVDNLKGSSFSDIKYGFAHEITHRYAAENGFPDYDNKWLNLTGWKQLKNRCSAAQAEKNKYCFVYNYPNQMDDAKKWSGGQDDLPGFASPYSVTTNYEDFAETFAHMRYSRDIYDRAAKDPVLAQKVRHMQELFGVSYEFADSTGCQGTSLKSDKAAVDTVQ